MKHRKAGRKLSRERNQRRALKKTLLGSLILREKMMTTEAKAKEVKPMIDKLITKAKKIEKSPEMKIAIIRQLRSELALVAVKKITGEFLTRFNDRTSGYTRITKVGPRKSDAARMAIIEFV